MGSLANLLTFAVYWVGIMALIGLALAITQKFRKKDQEKTLSGEEYAKQFEKEMAEPTPEKPIKKFLRNPYVLSSDEIKETKEETEKE